MAATDSSNDEPSWSNYGSCVDIWAPGVSILSTYDNGAPPPCREPPWPPPHVAGTGGLHLSKNTTASPATAEATLKANVLSPGTTIRDGRAIKIVYAGEY